jgi:hypothetical protein
MMYIMMERGKILSVQIIQYVGFSWPLFSKNVFIEHQGLGCHKGIEGLRGGRDKSSLLLMQVKSEWEAVVYGKTEDQRIMTEQARQYLGSTYPSSACTSRALVL